MRRLPRIYLFIYSLLWCSCIIILVSGHTDGSPFPSGQSMASPGASNWPGSPGVPRQSPRPGISPNPALHSPTDVKTGMHYLCKCGLPRFMLTLYFIALWISLGAGTQRVLPQRSWAGAVPTLISHEALDILCTPSVHPQGLPGPELAPLER